ncbi:hypothetical protein R1flu_006981 [Riccia fluitans]|uniref:Uncharacterized protein n=1 Tax=Riccia fluitans TaxID=41844 RepID=A0ABD1Z0K8_9MARC
MVDKKSHGFVAELGPYIPHEYLLAINMTVKERAERDYHSSMKRVAVHECRRRCLTDIFNSSDLENFVSDMSLGSNGAEYLITISLGTPAQLSLEFISLSFMAVADTGTPETV